MGRTAIGLIDMGGDWLGSWVLADDSGERRDEAVLRTSRQSPYNS